MKRGLRAGLLLLAVCILTGCSSFSPEISGISIDKNGGVTEYVRESFDKGYYDKDEVQRQIESEIAGYNQTAGSRAVKKKGFSVKNGTAQLRMTYASWQDYAGFNHLDFYMGDIQGAVQVGYAFEGSFYEVADGQVKQDTAIWGSQIMTGANYHTVALRQAQLVKVPGNIRYVSENVKVTDKSTAVLEENETAYILYE